MLAALLWWGGAEAQDVILLRNADEVKAEVREITDSHILYTLWGGSDKVLSLPRAEVFSVTYQNGERSFSSVTTPGRRVRSPQRITRGPG